MKLDDTVCRGSLIIHNGVSYVVVAVGWGSRQTINQPAGKAWKITPAPKDGVWAISDKWYLDEGADVDTIFPGAVFEIPDYIL